MSKPDYVPYMEKTEYLWDKGCHMGSYEGRDGIWFDCFGNILFTNGDLCTMTLEEVKKAIKYIKR